MIGLESVRKFSSPSQSGIRSLDYQFWGLMRESLIKPQISNITAFLALTSLSQSHHFVDVLHLYSPRLHLFYKACSLIHQQYQNFLLCANNPLDRAIKDTTIIIRLEKFSMDNYRVVEPMHHNIQKKNKSIFFLSFFLLKERTN